jgi:hypothetical protein
VEKRGGEGRGVKRGGLAPNVTARVQIVHTAKGSPRASMFLACIHRSFEFVVVVETNYVRCVIKIER